MDPELPGPGLHFPNRGPSDFPGIGGVRGYGTAQGRRVRGIGLPPEMTGREPLC